MSDEGFTVTEVTVGMDGEVVRPSASESHRTTPAPRKAPHQEPSDAEKVSARLSTLDNDLRQLSRAYSDAWDAWSSAWSGSPLQSPTYDRKRAGKPASSPPPEPEGKTRMLMVVCAQRLAMSLRILAVHDWLDGPVWHPESLQRSIVIVRDPHTPVPLFKPDGTPDWRDPADVTVEPVDIDPGVSKLRGVVVDLCDVDWSKQDRADLDVVRDVLHEAEEAIGAVVAAGTWPVSRRKPEESKTCDECWKAFKGRRGQTCPACVQRGYRERKKAS